MTLRMPGRLGKLAVLSVPLVLGLGLISPAGHAEKPPPPTAPAADAPETTHVRSEPADIAEIAPFPASDHELRRDYDDPAARDEPDRPSMSGAETAGACDPSDFTGRTGDELVAFIKTSETECINTLFSLSGADAGGAFREEQMVSVANGFAGNAASYPGDNSTGTTQLVLYLRAGYYVQWSYPDDVGEYGPALRTAIQTGLDRFFGNPNSRLVSDANGETLSEAVILIDSSQQNARYLHIVKRLLSDYDAGYDEFWWMVNAVNSVYTVLFRGHQVPAFVTAVERDPSVLDEVERFAVDHIDLLGGDNAFLVANAGRELGRFLQHASLREKVRPQALNLLNRSQITGTTARLWVGVAEMTAYYDGDNCSYFNTCDLADRLIRAALPISHTCGDTIRIRAQDMTGSQLSGACDSMTNQDTYFHEVADDSGPVADDNNTTIEVVVFDSSTDYQTYAGAIYGIDTNNGGMYLEGDPSAPGNQPRFIAYEAEWQRPDFAIWNLNHEYTHYLDGRFNMYGDFAAGVSTPTIWWIEGFAEYISYSYRDVEYTEAIDEAAKQTYTLDTVFATTYAHDTTRVYRWGYLAVRFMLQNHPDDVATVLGYYRSGDWNAAYSYLSDTIGSAYNQEWNSWLAACGAGDCGGPV